MSNSVRFCLVVLLAPFAVAPSLGQSSDVLHQARTAQVDGDYATVVRLLESTPPAERTGEAAYVLATSYQALAKHTEAVEVLAALTEADYDATRVLTALGRSYNALGRPDEAMVTYRAALAADSTSVPVALSLARMLGSVGRHAEAAELYHRLVYADPGNPTLRVNLGRAYDALGEVDSAIVHLQTAHRLDPASVRTALTLSRVYAQDDYLISARRVVNRTLQDAPTSTLLWARRGEIAMQESEYPVASHAYNEALTLGDSSSAIWRGLGVALYFQAQIDSAQTALLASFEADPTHEMTPFYLGMTHQAYEEWDEALDYFAIAADNMGRSLITDLYAQIATTYDQMDRDGEAIRVYRLVQGLAPERPETLFHLAALYDAYYADRDATLRQYEAFLERVPEERLPQMRSYARERVRVLRQEAFFRPSATPDATSPDSTRDDRE